MLTTSEGLMTTCQSHQPFSIMPRAAHDQTVLLRTWAFSPVSAVLPVLVLALILSSFIGLFPTPAAGVGKFPPGDIWFPPNGRVDAELVKLIDAAIMEIKFAFYDIDLPLVGEALISAHNRGILVEVVTDNDTSGKTSYVDELEAAGIEVKRDGDSGLMHDKFAVIDNKIVWMGSTNATENGFFRNNNNVIVIEDVLLANNFRVEFEEMFNDEQFGAGSPANTPRPALNINGVTVETLFAPEDGVTAKIVSEIAKATTFIYFEAFSYTSNPIFDAMKARMDAGVYIKGIFEEMQVLATAKYTKYKPLRRLGADVILDTNPNNMHNKLMIIDGATVITGSFNFSAAADEKNDESILILRSPLVADLYMKEFARLFSEFTPGEAVRGFVKTAATGVFISGAKVTIKTTGAVAESDDTGWYRFVNVPEITYTIRAEKEGYFAYEADLVEPVERHDVTLSPIVDQGTVTGRAIDSTGAPIEGVAVEIAHTSGAGVTTYLKAVTGGDGGFSVSGVPATVTDADRVRVTLSRASFLDVVKPAVSVAKDGITDLGNIGMTRNFLIAGFMNPAISDYATITVASGAAGATVPRVTVTQNNYVPVPVTMAAVKDRAGFFAGSLKVLSQYTGPALIDVNSGAAGGSLYVFLLEPRRGITVEASAKVAVHFPEGAVAADQLGLVSMGSVEEIAGGKQVSQTLSITPGIGLLKPALISFKSSDWTGPLKRLGLYRRGESGWIRLDTAVDHAGSARSASVYNCGFFALIADMAPPVIDPRVPDDAAAPVRVLISDSLSGVDWNSVTVSCGNVPVEGLVARAQGGILEIPRSAVNLAFERAPVSKAMEKAVPLPGGGWGIEGELREALIEVSASDTAGNLSSVTMKVSMTRADPLTGAIAYPNPARNGETITFRVTLGADAELTLDILDFTGSLVARVIREERAAGVHEISTWAAIGRDGRPVANGTYFFRVEARTGTGTYRKFGKISILR